MAATFVTLRQVAPKASSLLKMSSNAAICRNTRTLATFVNSSSVPAFATEHMTLNEKPASGLRTLEWFSVETSDFYRETDNEAAKFDDLANIVNPPSEYEIFRRWI